jgi:hypothetical protein
MTVVVSSSSKEIMANPARLIEAMQAGSIISIPDLDYTIVPTTAIAGLAEERAEEELLEEMVSYRKDVTGVENTIFILPRVTRDTRRGLRSLSIRRCQSILGAKPHRLQLPTARLWQVKSRPGFSTRRDDSSMPIAMCFSIAGNIGSIPTSSVGD